MTQTDIGLINLLNNHFKKINVMKRIFTFAIALMSLLATTKAANVVFNVTVPSPTYQVWIVGSFNGWNNADKQLTKVDDTHFTITMDDATWAAGVTTANVEYKYLSGGGDWAYVEKYADGSEMKANRAYALGVVNTHKDANGVVDDTSAPGNNGTDVVAKWAAVYNPTVLPLPLNVTIDVLVPAGTFQCYIVGTFNSWAGPTAPADSVKMVLMGTNPDGTKIFEKTIYTADANKLAYHFCCGPDWSFEQKTPSGDFKYDATGNNVIVTEWKAIYDPTKLGNVTVVATVPATGAQHVFIQGGFMGWSWTTPKEMTKNIDGTYSSTISNIISTEYRLYNLADWTNPEVDATGAERANRSVTATPGTTITENIVVIGWKVPTALKALNMDKYKVYTTNHSLVVEGVTSQVDVYDVSGRNLQSAKMVGTFKSKTLNAGLYILRVDGATQKVAVQ